MKISERLIFDYDDFDKIYNFKFEINNATMEFKASNKDNILYLPSTKSFNVKDYISYLQMAEKKIKDFFETINNRVNV